MLIAIALQPDGKLVVAGYSDSGGWDFSLARFNPDGSLDNTFSGDGIVITQVGSDDSTIEALALQADGKIIAAGYVEGVHHGFCPGALQPGWEFGHLL